MPNVIDLTGKRYGRWTVIRQLPIGSKGAARWECRCDCGTTKEVGSQSLRNGRSQSCGCLSQESRTKHGGSYSAEYRIWNSMKRRCSSQREHEQQVYGRRGIVVCERWKNSFSAFLEDMGPRPTENHSIDRIDGSGNYEPGNVRWATWEQQNSNRSNVVLITYKGVTNTVSWWARKIGVKPTLLFKRLYRGWTIENAIDTPVVKKKRE